MATKFVRFFYIETDNQDEDDMFKILDNRTIVWVQNIKGWTGKFKFVKWLYVNHPLEITKISFWTSVQIRWRIVNEGARKCYFIDIPRTPGKEYALDNIINALKNIKNDHVVKNSKQLLLDPRHVIIFSNQPCPQSKMSNVRWKIFEIKDNKLIAK